VNFAKRLKQIGLEHECRIIDGAPHTFDLHPQGSKHVDVRKIVLSFFDRHLRGLTRKAADARYAALTEFERKHRERVVAGRWTGSPGKVKEVAPDRSWFTLANGNTVSRIILSPKTVYVVQRPGAAAEIKNRTLIRLDGKSSKDGVFQVTSVLCYPPGANRRQHVYRNWIIGRWVHRGESMRVSVRGAKHPVRLDGTTAVNIRMITTPGALVPGANIITVIGKRFGKDLYASRVVAAAP
jgi:hypothetical protein